MAQEAGLQNFRIQSMKKMYCILQSRKKISDTSLLSWRQTRNNRATEARRCIVPSQVNLCYLTFSHLISQKRNRCKQSEDRWITTCSEKESKLQTEESNSRSNVEFSSTFYMVSRCCSFKSSGGLVLDLWTPHITSESRMNISTYKIPRLGSASQTLNNI